MPEQHTPRIVEARAAAEIAAVRMLFRDYADGLGVSLDFQGFEAELAGLPGDYRPPQGALLLATEGGRAVGCVALRSLDGAVCEIKRLYVAPAARGSGLGRLLAEEILLRAAALGYRAARLDTLASMAAAKALYLSLGFQEIPAYYDNPLAGTTYLERKLG